MKSMTGYGSATAALDGGAVTVQVSAVNRRALDLVTALPSGWDGLEAEVGERVRLRAARGRVQVRIEFAAAPGAAAASWDKAAVAASLDQLAALAAANDVPFKPSPELLWQIAGSQRRASELPSPDAARPAVRSALDQALHEFAIMKAKEGEALLVDLLARLTLVQRHLDAVAARAPHMTPAYRELLLKRLREAGLEIDLADERVLREIALFADRCDISEELTRCRSHLDQLTALFKSDGEIGRKAEFILQEIGREVHTLGNKANDLAISRHVIELKNELERVREQIANVE
jgi:uncharacterized protein (TIGR00255 family)